MGVTVRYAKIEELERVNALRQMVNQIHADNRPDFFRPGFCEELRQVAYRLYNAQDGDVIVACVDGVVCGFAIVRYISRQSTAYTCAQRFYHIEEFGVDAAFRRRGVATAMIRFCRQEAERMQFSKLCLDVWAFNDEARKFYEAAGFRTYRYFMESGVEYQKTEKEGRE